MKTFQVHTLETAPEASKQPLRDLKAAVGFLPNLAAAMSGSPQLLRGFLAVRTLYEAGTFTPGEIQVLSLTAAFENDCSYCMAFHTAMALKVGVSRESVDALRQGRKPVEPRLGALSEFARKLVRTRGAVERPDVESLVEAGFRSEQALEVVLGLAFSLMANYAGHLVDAPLDPPFQTHAWQHPAALHATA